MCVYAECLFHISWVIAYICSCAHLSPLYYLYNPKYARLSGITPLIDNFNHIGGLIFGFLCGMSTMERVSHAFFGVEEKRCWGTFKNIFARFFGLIISIAGIMAATIILLEGDGVTNPCESCSALSCISFPPWNPQDNRWWYCDDCSQVTAE